MKTVTKGSYYMSVHQLDSFTCQSFRCPKPAIDFFFCMTISSCSLFQLDVSGTPICEDCDLFFYINKHR